MNQLPPESPPSSRWILVLLIDWNIGHNQTRQTNIQGEARTREPTFTPLSPPISPHVFPALPISPHLLSLGGTAPGERRRRPRPGDRVSRAVQLLRAAHVVCSSVACGLLGRSPIRMHQRNPRKNKRRTSPELWKASNLHWLKDIFYRSVELLQTRSLVLLGGLGCCCMVWVGMKGDEM